jgi:signal transduction histidine kinase/CheY-like chemotaxis protein
VVRYIETQLLGRGHIACLEQLAQSERWIGDPRALGIEGTSWLENLFSARTDTLPAQLEAVLAPNGIALSIHRFQDQHGRYTLIFKSAPSVAGRASDQAEQSSESGHEQALGVIANSESGTMFASFAHEFGTPLTALLGQLELLQSIPMPDAAQVRLAAVRRSAQHLHGLVQGLLDEQRLAAGTLELSPVSLNIAELERDLRAMFEAEAARRGVQISWEFRDDDITVDAVRLRQILINLLSNALKYGDETPIEISVEVKELTLHARVRDFGPGFNPNQRALLFGRFQRFAGRNTEGLGLGLHIARQLARSLHGELELKIAVRPGACFELRIPVMPAEEVLAIDDMTELLVVDDDPDVRAITSALLAQHRYSVAEAHDTHSALMQVALEPEVMLVDLELGTESGLDLIARVRSDGFKGKVIATSANHDRQRVRAARTAGANAFVGKPFNSERLIRALRAKS